MFCSLLTESPEWSLPEQFAESGPCDVVITGSDDYVSNDKVETATRDTDFLRQAERVMDGITHRMTETETGWVLESFGVDWRYASGANGVNEINLGPQHCCGMGAA